MTFIKCPYLMNTYNPKHQQKLKSIPLAEQNYFVHFAMRYPVLILTYAIIRDFLSLILTDLQKFQMVLNFKWNFKEALTPL